MALASSAAFSLRTRVEIAYGYRKRRRCARVLCVESQDLCCERLRTMRRYRSSCVYKFGKPQTNSWADLPSFEGEAVRLWLTLGERARNDRNPGAVRRPLRPSGSLQLNPIRNPIVASQMCTRTTKALFVQANRTRVVVLAVATANLPINSWAFTFPIVPECAAVRPARQKRLEIVSMV